MTPRRAVATFGLAAMLAACQATPAPVSPAAPTGVAASASSAASASAGALASAAALATDTPSASAPNPSGSSALDRTSSGP